MKSIDEIHDLIIKKMNNNYLSELKHNNFIYTGRNMSGKSHMIKTFVQKNSEYIYYIDSVNRTIPTDNPSYNFDSSIVDEINIYRIEKNNFNKKDVFTSSINNSIILNELVNHPEKYNPTISNYFDTDFKVKKVQSLFNNYTYTFCFGDTIYEEISSGYQAIIRILVELCFAKEANRGHILIDEIDSHLDSENCYKLIDYIENTFPNIVFILSTHSSDIILRAKNYNIINIINQDNCEIYDSNDMDDLNYINRTLFSNNHRKDSDKNSLDRILGNYIRLLANGYKLNYYENQYVTHLTNLTTKQLVLKEYILRWTKV